VASPNFFDFIFEPAEGTSSHERLGRRNARGGWIWTSAGELQREAEGLAAGLVAYGVRPGDRVAVLSDDCLEAWSCELAVLGCGACCVPLAAGIEGDRLRDVLKAASSRVALVSSVSTLERLLLVRPDLPDLDLILLLEQPQEPGAIPAALAHTARMLGAEILAAEPGVLRRSREAVHGSDPAYAIMSATDGATVLLSHDNMIAAARALVKTIPLGPKDRAVSLLPNGQIAGRPWFGALMVAGAGIAFADREESVPDQLRELRPTLGLVEGRFIDAHLRELLRRVLGRSVTSRLVLPFARRAGLHAARSGLAANRLDSRRTWVTDLADRAILERVRQAAGGKLRFFVSVGEPLGERRVRAYLGMGLPVLEGVGIPATTGVLCQNTPRAFRPGTVGQPLPGTGVRIDEDGQIWVRGSIVEQGRALAGTSQVAGRSWFRTGLVGVQDEDGFLHVV
jgi:long-chain acyl-CoA synthetase